MQHWQPERATIPFTPGMRYSTYRQRLLAGGFEPVMRDASEVTCSGVCTALWRNAKRETLQVEVGGVKLGKGLNYALVVRSAEWQ